MKPLKECRVLVTPTSFGRYDNSLRDALEGQVGEVIYNTSGHPLSSDELIPLIAQVDGYIAGLDTIDRKTILEAKCLKVIARYGVGIDDVDLEAAREKGIIVTNTPGANSSSVAELTIAFILLLARHLSTALQATKVGEWPRLQGVILSEKTIGLIGLGEIGKQVAYRLRCFDCNLVAYDPFLVEKEASKYGVELLSREKVIEKADFLSLHCPIVPSTRLMVNKDFLRLMKPSSYLINTARGELIEETALLDSLNKDELAGAALDVFTKQPPDKNNPLLVHPKVIVTPHMGAHTDDATNSMGWSAINDCLAVLQGEEPVHRVI
jgi:D-3-phosphoglycerate dehydrogenase / 2-oxoglutarate reductase